ncbi:hypothetical protein BH23GEM8_BH23GEM8_15160 [soil metagenome]
MLILLKAELRGGSASPALAKSPKGALGVSARHHPDAVLFHLPRAVDYRSEGDDETFGRLNE